MMSTFLRAHFRHFPKNPIKKRIGLGVGLLCGFFVMLAMALPLQTQAAIGFSGATITPSVGSPQLVCSGSSAVITLNISTCSLGSGPDWSANYTIDSSSDGGTTWFTPSGASSGFVASPTGSIVYTSPVLTSTSCYTLTYRFRLTGIVAHCFGNVTYTSPLAVVQVCPQPAPITGGSQVCSGQTLPLSTTSTGGTWGSSDVTKATVTSSGVVTGAGAGVATITYRFPGGCYSTHPVTVNALPATPSGPTTLCVGATGTYTLAVVTAGTWSSSNTATGTINSSTGVFTALAAGTTNIVYTNTPSGCTSSFPITVNPLPADIGCNAPICSGGSITLCSATSGGTWTSTTPSIASIDPSTGVVTAGGSASGTTIITYTAGGCIDTIIVTVNPLPATIAGSNTICAGDLAVYTDASPGGFWSSSNPAVADFADSTVGNLQAGTAGGTTVITYRFPTGCFATKSVTVNALPAAFAGATICVGTCTTLSSSPAGGTWTSSTPAVGTVGFTTGSFCGISNGTANVTYTIGGGCRTVATMTVAPTPGPITGTLTVCAANTTTLSNAVSGGTWSSLNTTAATVNPTLGIVLGGSAFTPPSDTATIVYDMGSGCKVSAVVTVYVTPTPITPASPVTVCLGQTRTLVDGTPGGTWSSQVPAVATVNPTTGVVTGMSLGSSTITYKVTVGGCFVTTTVTVQPVPAPISGTTTLCSGACAILSDATPGGTWTSTNPAVANVDTNTGNWCGGSPGSDIVSYTLPSGCRATIVVSVNPNPDTIMGASGVCVGSSTTLTTATPGVVWSSSMMPIGSIDATTGTVLGVAGGGPITITATNPSTGCFTSIPFTVYDNPVPIDGADTVCVSGNVTLTDGTAGGSWSSSNPGIASINSITGVVTGNAAGVATITYRIAATGCFRTLNISVRPLPASITGYPRTCIGFCTPLNSATPGGIWTSNNTSVATVSSAGLLCGVSPDTTYIVYTLPTGCARNVLATVDPIPAPPTGVLSICVGSSTTLSHTIPGGTWSSSDTLVATVYLGTGVVIGRTAGTTNITYTTASGCMGVATVTVNPVPPAITGTLYMCAGNSTTLSDLFPGGAWSSVNPAIGSISTTGVYTGSSAGTDTVRYTLASGCSATTVVTVYPLPVISGSVLVCPGIAAPLTGSPSGGLWVSSNTGIATIGSLSGIVNGVATGTANITYTLASTCRTTTQVTVLPLPANITGPSQVCEGSTITLINLTTGGGHWSSGTPSVATIDTTGLVTGISAGTTRITFTSNTTGCITTTVVTVNPLPSYITGPMTLCVNDSVTLSDGTPGGTWSVTGGHATIGSSTGVLTGTSAGTANVTYTLATGCYATYTVTVQGLPAITSSVLSICHGYTLLLSADTTGIWSISPASVATIDTDGLVTAVSPGTATVTFTSTSTGCMTTAVITVNPLPSPITGILNICLNDTTTLHDATPGGTWSSENPLIAVINPSSGLLASVTAGTVTISYTLPTGCYVTAVMTINPIPQPITGIFALCQGDTTTLSNITTGGSWSSSNPTVATIGTATGFVTAVSPGVTNITYTLPSSCPRVIQFTVNLNPTPITGPLSICKGDTVILSSTPAGGTWSSSTPAHAFIFMPTGQMIGIDLGTATITYMLPTGCFTAATAVVNPVPTASTITGSRVVCLGSTATLSNPAFPGGTWSSQNPSIATINPSTGFWVGMGVGTTHITYTLPTGCDTFITVTVNPLPAPITGVMALCQGASTALFDADGPGTWSSTPPIAGSIDPVTGVYTAAITGSSSIATVVVTYVLASTGCQTTAVLTVNPLPGPILGVAEMCLGASTTLNVTPTGGGWSSGNVFVATVAASSSGFDTAIVSSLSVGTSNITYTLPTGCLRTITVTVHPLPAAITGPDTVCVGSSITLQSVPSVIAGTWSVSNGHATISSIDTATGSLTGVSAGKDTVTYTSAWGCTATFVVTVHPIPNPITGPTNLCVGFTDTMKTTSVGGHWSVSDTSLASIVDTTGVITGRVAGTVTVTYQFITSCFVTYTVNIRPLPTITVNHPTQMCKYASVVLNASGAVTYTWSPGTGLSATTGATVTASPTITTTYTITGSSSFGCPNTATTTVWVDSLLNGITVVGDTLLCKGECTVLMAHGRQGTFFNWKPATGLSCTICDTVTACPTQTTTYTLVAIDSLGCRDSLDVPVIVKPLPRIQVLPNPAIVCNGSTAQLFATDLDQEAGTTTKFAWFPNAYLSCDTCSNPTLSNTFNLVYRVTGFTEYGCYDSIKVPVSVLDSAFNSINNDTVICKGGSAQLDAVSINPDGARSSFHWLNSDVSNPYIQNPVVSPQVTTTYTVNISPNVCFPRTLYTTVVVVDAPEIDITKSTGEGTIAAGTPVTLTASIRNGAIISSYAWSPPGTLSCDTCYTTIATPTATTTYTFTATSGYGCTGTGTVTINLGCDNSQVFVPNTFTPNGDGMNDRFFINAKGISLITKFSVFNRWGEMVYEQTNIPPNDPSYGWDGQYKGVVLPPDVFYYFVEVKCSLDGTVFKYKGDVSIVK